MMNVFYNPKGVGDTLLIQLSTNENVEIGVKKKGDMARIYDINSSKTLGYNLFNASKTLSLHGNGKIDIDEAFVNKLNTMLMDEGFSESLKYDDRPSFIAGYVNEMEKHPNADKLNVCQVDIGTETLQIVCGALNVDKGQKVVVARVGAVMPSGMLIKEAELRGVPSSGMICSAKELALPNASEQKGILVLDEGMRVGEKFSLAKAD